MSDTQRTVDRSTPADGASADAHGSPPREQAGRTSEAQQQASATPTTASSRRVKSPGASGAPGGADEQSGQRAASDADEDALQGDVDELVAAAAQRDEYLALAQRTQADFENYRKRVAKEASAAQERGVVKLAKELLPALDNLDRALDEGAAAAERDGHDAPLLEGVRLVRSELHAALARAGIESFSPKGEPFDPSKHEAMAQQPVPDVPSGTVAEVFAPGYRLGDCVIRAARVLVAA